MSSVRFNCPHCKLGLSVPERRAGTEVRCPSCRETLKVPASSQPLEPPAPPPEVQIDAPASAPPELEPVIETPEIQPQPLSPNATVPPPAMEPREPDEEDTGSPASQQRVDDLGRQHRINLSRSVIYLQGALLAGVGIVGLMCGLLIGWGTADPGMVPATRKSATVRGQVTYADGRFDTPDPGAVVIVLPRGTFPSERIPIDSIKPGNAPLADDDPTIQEIRRMGGDITRTGSNGQFRLRVSTGGSFYLLAISHNHPRDGVIKVKDLGEISNYFRGTSELIGDKSYRWTRESLKGTRTISILFP